MMEFVHRSSNAKYDFIKKAGGYLVAIYLIIQVCSLLTMKTS